MLFSSPIFLFAFLPVFLLLYVLVGRRFRNLLLLAASVVFYTWGEGRLVAIMLTSTLIDYVAGLAIARGFTGAELSSGKRHADAKRRSPRQVTWLIVSIVGNLSLLGFFKYFDFGIKNLNSLLQILDSQHLPFASPWKILLPLGISFYTFQSMSYTIDIFRGRIGAISNFVDYATYVTMFPQLVAGPIVRYETVEHELIDRNMSRTDFAEGVRRFVIGLGKKMLIANQVAVPADAVFSLPPDAWTTPLAWFGVLCYTLQIYFDFSGYSDMAIGLGRMVGFHFQENFDFPYVAQSMREFWRRWHISLSTWFRDYLYFPLGGNRHGAWRTYRNLLIVFLVTGLWHGASWTFVVWGAYHGCFLLIERAGFGDRLAATWRPLQHAYVLLAVAVGWVIFRSSDLDGAWHYLRALVGFGMGDGKLYRIELLATPVTLLAICAGAIGSLPVISWLRRHVLELWRSLDGSFARVVQTSWSTMMIVSLVVVFILTIMHMANDTYNPFIYFRF